MSQDKKDLDKFVKFLAFKTVQIVVQSRLGDKIKTDSKTSQFDASNSYDWVSFSLFI